MKRRNRRTEKWLMRSRGSIISSSEQPHADGGKLAMSTPSEHGLHTRIHIYQHTHTKSCFQLVRHIACAEHSKRAEI